YSMSSDKSIHFWNIRSEDCELSRIGLGKMQIKSQDQNVIIFERSTKSIHMPRKLLSMNPDVLVNYSLLEDRRVLISEELVSSKKTYELYGNYCKQLCVAGGFVSSFTNDTHC